VVRNADSGYTVERRTACDCSSRPCVFGSLPGISGLRRSSL